MDPQEAIAIVSLASQVAPEIISAIKAALASGKQGDDLLAEAKANFDSVKAAALAEIQKDKPSA